MQDLDLYGTVNTVVCSLDSVNHLPGAEELEKAFQRVSFFLEPGGWFLFDANTPYKHEKVLGNHTFVYDMEHVYCVWQNRFHPGQGRVDISLDFFQREGKLYRRKRRAVLRVGLSPGAAAGHCWSRPGSGRPQFFGELSFDPPGPESQRWMVAAQKKVRKGA